MLSSFDAWIKRVHPTDRLRLQERIANMVAMTSDDLWREEYRARYPVTGERWIMGWGRVERDATGHAACMAGINFDITEASV